MADIANFKVIIIRPNEALEPLRPNTTEYTHMASCIRISLQMLSTSVARRALAELSLEYDATRQPLSAWYHGNNYGPLLDRNTAGQVVDLYLSTLHRCL